MATDALGLQALQIPGMNGDLHEVHVEASATILAQPDPTEYAKRIARHVMFLLEDEALPMVGITEAGTILGVSRQRVDQLHKNGSLPELHQKLAATPLWKTVEIIEYAVTRRKVPGPPKKQKASEK